MIIGPLARQNDLFHVAHPYSNETLTDLVLTSLPPHLTIVLHYQQYYNILHQSCAPKSSPSMSNLS